MSDHDSRALRCAAFFLAMAMLAAGQSYRPDSLGYTVATPRPIDPAQGTTNPSAQATQRQNPYLGSAAPKATDVLIRLSLSEAIERGLRYNLGLIESNHAGADVRAMRLRALSALLPQLSAEGRQAYDDISYKEIGLKLPPIPNFPSLPATTGGFGFEDARVRIAQSIYDAGLREKYKASKSAEAASVWAIKDSRDVVVFAVGTAYMQVIASAARVETAKAQVASAQELDRETKDRLAHELSPEIDSIRAQVELQTAEQRLTNANNALEKDKLTLARIAGLAIDQKFEVSDALAYRPLTALTPEAATQDALQSRADLASAEASVREAELIVRAQRAQRLPVVSVGADYGAGGANPANMSQVYSVSANVSVPLYTGGRIRADVAQAQNDLSRRQAEYEDLKGRVAYDVRVAWLDVSASDAGVKVAERNRELSVKGLAQSQDRYANGVTNYLEVVQAQEAVAAADENYIGSLFSFNVAKIALARALGSAETRLPQLLGGN